MVAKACFESGILVVSVIYLILAAKLPLGTLNQPGPGFLPTILGILGAVISIWMLSQSIKEKMKNSPHSEPVFQRIEKLPLIKLTIYLVVFILLILLYEYIGTIAGIFILTAILSKIYGMKGYIKPILLGVFTTAFIYLVFKVWFMIPLP